MEPSPATPFDPAGRAPRAQEAAPAPDAILGSSLPERSGEPTTGDRPGPGGSGVPLWLWVVTGLIGVAYVPYIFMKLTPLPFGVGLLLALIPFAVAMAVILWLDRPAPEPPRVKWFALLWGTTGATAIPFLINTLVIKAIGESLGKALAAPVVEEAFKAVGVLLIIRFARRHFNGVLDGLLYGALAGIGFALVENIIYMGKALTAGNLAMVALLRGPLSPVGHPLYGALTGAAIGILMQRRHQFRAVLLIASALILHGLNNVPLLWLINFVFLSIPTTVLVVRWALRLRRREKPAAAPGAQR